MMVSFAKAASLFLASMMAHTGASIGGFASDDMLLAAVNRVHPVWLRERCVESFHADPNTRQPLRNIHELDGFLSLKILEVEDVGVAPEYPQGGFKVYFSDNQACYYRKEVLAADLSNELTFTQVREWDFPKEYLWDRQALIYPAKFNHDEVYPAKTDEARKFLSALLSTGIALVENVPRELGYVNVFAEEISSLRDTEWGETFYVKTSPDTDGDIPRYDLSYTPIALGMHTDNPYRGDSPPAFQLLHAIEHCTGGPPQCYVQNQFVDGFKVAADLCETNRKYFDILTKTVLRWENNGGDDTSLLYRYAPMIEVRDVVPKGEGCPRVTGINFSAKSGGYAPNLPYEELDLFYEAKHTISSLFHDPRYTVEFQMYPGLLVIFDNRRVLHSRSEIAPTDGDRLLQGCYINRDGIEYKYEQLRRQYRKLSETPFTSLEGATWADWHRMEAEYDLHVRQQTVTTLVKQLESQKNAFLGAPVSLYEHNLQTASRALRAGESEETVVMSLFHNIFTTMTVKNHGELISSMLAPWLSPQSTWALAHQEIFKGYYYFGYYGLDTNLRDMFVSNPFYNATKFWCENYVQNSYDPNYPSVPLSTFLPMVERVLSRPQYWWNPRHPKATAVMPIATVPAATIAEPQENATSGPLLVADGTCRDTWTCYAAVQTS